MSEGVQKQATFELETVNDQIIEGLTEQLSDARYELDKLRNEETDSGLLAYEKERREKFFRASTLALFISVLLFVALAFWIFQNVNTPSSWHTTLILSIAPTTILLFTLKTLAKPESNDDASMPQAEVLGQAVQIILDFFGKNK